MRLYELQSGGLEDELDKQLDDAGASAETGQNSPDLPSGVGSPAPEQKPIDSAMMSNFESLPYVKQYNFEDNSKLNPLSIMGMPLDQLSNLRNLVRTKINMETIQDNFGLYDNPSMKFYQDLLGFVERVMAYNKQHGGEETEEVRPSPPVQAQQPPNTSPGQQMPAQPGPAGSPAPKPAGM